MTVHNNVISIVETRNDLVTLKVRGDDGSIKTLHSIYDPVAEAKSIIEAFQFDGRGTLAVLGLGLGYHVKELADKYPEAQIVVIEALTEIYDLAEEHFPEIRDVAEFITGRTPDQALREIAALQMKEGIKPLAVFALPAAVSAFPSYYQPVLNSLKKTISVKLWDRLRYPKFRNDVLTVALVDTGYFLVQEVEKALESSGHRVVRIAPGSDDGKELMPRFVQHILEHKPDYVLTINHLGFDEQGVLTAFLRSIEMPVASWYVDSPRLIVQAHQKNVSPYVSMFLWDREYMGEMRGAGFESVTYLPLGTDETVFRPIALNQYALRRYGTDVCFVGNSLVGATEEKLRKIRGRHHAAVDSIARRICDTRMSFDDAVRERSYAFEDLTVVERLDMEAAALWKATLLYRMSCIEELKDLRPQIYGDNGWKSLLNGSYVINGPLNYYNELPLLYNACRVNFNATHLQMGESVNQRVFDVPACGAFLLTDYQKSLDELFDIGEEIIVYRDRGEIPELSRYYLDNPEKRDYIAQRGRARILKEHTYKHRLGKMVREMVRRYKKN